MHIKIRAIKKGIWVICLLLMGTISDVYGQQINVSGTVKDAKTSETLPGVNILVKGTMVGTATDQNGNYELSVPDEADTLMFSYIGYKKESIPVNGRKVINVGMTSSTLTGEELVVTALGISRNERRLGYSVTQIDGEDLAQSNAMNPVEALQGKAAGVNIESSDGGVFGGTKFSIRGASTLSGNNMPIFVVDGVILEDATSGGSEWSASPNDWGNQLRNLNPENFQSVSILKGAAATALYGSRAINGAVVIKTKSGNKGSGLGINISQTTGVQHVYDTMDLQNEFGPGTIAGYVSYGDKDANGNYYRFDTGQFNYRTVDGQPVPTLVGNGGLSFGPRFDSGIQVEGYDHQMTSYQAYPDNWKNAYDNGATSRTDVTLSGGTDKLSFYVNGLADINKGIYPEQQLNKYSGMLKASYDLTDFLKVEGSINYTHSIPKNPPQNIGESYSSGTFSRAYSTNKYKDASMYIADHGGVPSSAYGDQYADVPGNSLWFSTYEYSNIRTENTWRPILSLQADVYDWLTLTLSGNMNAYNYTAENEQLGQGYRNEGGYYMLSHHYQQQENGKFTANITRQLTNNIGFDATIGGELYHTKTSESGANTNGGLVVPGRFFLENSKEQRNNWAWVGAEKQINSVYALLSFSWKNQLFMDLTGRNDWSSALVYANGSGDYSYFYPSISGSWVFSETFDLPSWLSFGKLRASWARVGNDTDPYEINQGYNVNSIQTSDGYIYTNSFDRQLISPNLSPEQKRSYEVGANLQFADNRLGIDFTWYKENTFDQILDIPAPTTSGVSSQKINAGNIQNQGIELSVNATPIQSNDFSWDLSVNYTRNRNKILSLHEDVGDYKLLAGSPAYGNYRIGSAAYIGGDYGVLLSDILPAVYKTDDPSDPRNGMKVLNYDNTSRSAYFKRSGEVQKIGSIQPDFVGGFSSTLRYKNLSFNFLIDGRFGGYVASYTNRYGTAYGFTQSATKNLDVDHGGMTWTSQFDDTKGQTFDDGMLPEGVFADGTVITTPAGEQQDVGGMTFEDAYKAGYIEPTHASAYTYWTNSWGSGVINDNWFYELNYVSLRQIGISYHLPFSVSEQLGVQNITLGLKSRNVLYLYNSSPNNMNPETFRGNQSDYSYFERTPSPYSRSIFFTINLGL